MTIRFFFWQGLNFGKILFFFKIFVPLARKRRNLTDVTDCTQFFLLVLSSNLEKNMSHMTGAGSSAGAAAASAASAASAAATALVLPRSW